MCALSPCRSVTARAQTLYFCYGRQTAYEKQQRMAMQLYKHFKKELYLFWSAVCLLVQVSTLRVAQRAPQAPHQLSARTGSQRGRERPVASG